MSDEFFDPSSDSGARSVRTDRDPTPSFSHEEMKSKFTFVSIGRVADNKKLDSDIVEVYIDNQFYKGMLSIGTNPTIDDKNASLHTEVYILDFDQDIYDKEITIKFRDFLHDEIKFEGLEKLIEKLDEDKRLTESYDF